MPGIFGAIDIQNSVTFHEFIEKYFSDDLLHYFCHLSLKKLN